MKIIANLNGEIKFCSLCQALGKYSAPFFPWARLIVPMNFLQEKHNHTFLWTPHSQRNLYALPWISGLNLFHSMWNCLTGCQTFSKKSVLLSRHSRNICEYFASLCQLSFKPPVIFSGIRKTFFFFFLE